MVNIHLPPQDLLGIRFAYSPLVELVISYRMLRHAANYRVGFAGWAEQATLNLQGIEFAYLDAVMTPEYTADFLLLTPLAPVRYLADELQRLRETPEENVLQNLAYIIQIAPLTPIRQLFLDQPRQAIECLIQELIVFWERTLAGHWQQIIPILDNEILHRARSFALNGVEESLNQLAHNTSFSAGLLHIDRFPLQVDDDDYFLRGKGVQLVPSIFKTQSSAHIRSADRAMVIYPAFGIRASQAGSKSKAADESLSLLLGESKTAILSALTQPQSTQELARKLHLSAGGISQHLQRLREAGLVETYRSGYYVFYRLSSRGEKLRELFND